MCRKKFFLFIFVFRKAPVFRLYDPQAGNVYIPLSCYDSNLYIQIFGHDAVFIPYFCRIGKIVPGTPFPEQLRTNISERITYRIREDRIMPIRPVHLILLLVASCALVLVISAAASDCGCGGLTDSGPPSGWADAGNAAMDSYSGFGDTGGGSASGSSGGSSSSGSSGSLSGSSDGSSGSSGGGTSAGSADEAVLLTSKGISLLRQGDLNSSLEILNKSISYDPFNTKSWRAKADVLIALQRYGEAVAALDKVIKLDPASDDAYAKRGDALLLSGKFKDAITSYDHALAINPNIPGVPANRTLALDLSGGALHANRSEGFVTAVPTQHQVNRTPTAADSAPGTESVPRPAATSLPLPVWTTVLAMSLTCIAFRLSRTQ
jgi:hypothetical protein